MNTITFTIKGNHQDPFGNPFPKLKMTGKQHWTPKAQSYVMWKKFVQASLINELRIVSPESAQRCELNLIQCGKPLVLDHVARMDISIAWKNGAHGDPENIFGSIADALFFNDKNLWGSFSPLHGEHGGEVRCIITVSDTPLKKETRRIIK